MLRVALTGGLASGKSFVGKNLEAAGCLLVKADELGHQTLLPDGEAYRAAVSDFGPEILAPDGRIDRKKLASIVFPAPEKLAKLNAAVHPAVRRKTQEILDAYFLREPQGIAVVEAAIHIETGGYRNYDCLVLAWCRPEQQLERAMLRDGMSREEAEARLSRQMPLEEKRRYADYIVDTSGTKEETARQTAEVYQKLRSKAQ